MSDFGEQVEEAAATVWRLMLWDVPDNLGGLAARLGFRQTKKNPRHWWRTFNAVSDRELAERSRSELLAAGIRGSWGELPTKKTQTSAQILSIQKAAQERVASGALKLAQEKRRQAEQLAHRETYHKAESAVRRARGDE